MCDGRFVLVVAAEAIRDRGDGLHMRRECGGEIRDKPRSVIGRVLGRILKWGRQGQAGGEGQMVVV